MPQFAPNEEKVAVATFPVKPAGLECTAELWLASNLTKVATSGGIPFIATGVDQSIALPITMPSAEGTYPVYLHIFSDGQLIAAYKAVEDVVIAPVGVAEFAYVSSIRLTGEREYIAGGMCDGYAVDIKNIGTVAGVCTINVLYKYYVFENWYTYTLGGELYRVRSLNLEPGQIGTFTWWNYNYNENPAISGMTTWGESEAGRTEDFRR